MVIVLRVRVPGASEVTNAHPRLHSPGKTISGFGRDLSRQMLLSPPSSELAGTPQDDVGRAWPCPHFANEMCAGRY